MIIDSLSQEHQKQLDEYFKAKNDIIYFVEHYCKIPTPGGNKLIKLYEPQKEVLKSFINDHYCVSLKSRQVGFSCITQCYICYCCTFFENVVIGVVSRSGSEASDFNRKTTSLIDELPEWIRPKYAKRTEQTFILENGCQSFAAGVNPSNPQSIFRGKSLSILVADEVAFIPAIQDAYTAIAPALVKAQQTSKEVGNPYATLLISTPNRTTGIGKFYFDMWRQANAGQSIFKPIKLHWKMIKEFANDPSWYPTQCALLGNVKWRIAQELDMQFVANSDALFSTDTISKLNTIDTPVQSVTTINGYDLKHYSIPDKEKFYLIGVDTASASGSDSSTIWIMDYETNEQVAEFQEKLRVDDFCPILEQVCKIFPNNLIIPECNSYGNQVCEYLSRKGTFNVYQTKTQGTGKYRYGLYTNPMNRPLIIDALYTMVEENTECVKSKNTALELISLVDYGNGKIAADEGEHDDLCMAFAFCCYVKLYDPPKTLLSRTTTKEEKEFLDDIVNWNNDENGMSSIAPMLQQMNDNVDKETDPVKKNQMMNGVMRTFINTHLDELMQQRATRNPDQNIGGSCIDLLGILNGSTDTSWIK